MFKKKSANERLKDIGLLPNNLHMDSQDQNQTTQTTKKNYYAPEGTQDYLIGESQITKVQDTLIKPVNANMMNRVRKTAKWSQLYKTGPSIPPKNKASFLNRDDEEDDEEQPEIKDQILSSGTYRHM